MIEGLRVWPWLHEARRRNHPIDHLTDCGKCKQMNDRQTRQTMGCRWEPKDISLPVMPWSPSSLNPDWRMGMKDSEGNERPEPTVCPGYSTALPETIEAVRARVHWKEGGGLRDFCDEQPSDFLRVGVEILEGAIVECTNWAQEHPKEK